MYPKIIWSHNIPYPTNQAQWYVLVCHVRGEKTFFIGRFLDQCICLPTIHSESNIKSYEIIFIDANQVTHVKYNDQEKTT